MKILDNRQLTQIVEQTTKGENLSSLYLIETAAEAITNEITARWNRTTPVKVFAGWGNNGADALLTSLSLATLGYDVEVYLFNIKDRISPECRLCRDRVKNYEGDNLRLSEINGREPFAWPEPDAGHLIIDGLFGAGLDKPLPVSFQMLVRDINQSGAPVVAIDMPSGLMDEWNSGISRESIIHATLTLALGAPRLSFFIEENAECVGEFKVLDIGLSADAMRNAPYSYYLVQKNTIRQFLTPRNPYATKHDFGRLLIAGGKPGMCGAAALAAQGALRSGAGHVTIHSAADAMPVLQVLQPCALFSADANNQTISQIPDLAKYDTAVLGPGMGTDDLTADALEHSLKLADANSRPVVLDADALNCIAARPRMLNYIPVLSVLTPHAAEFDRLFGEQPGHEARLRKAIEVAQFHRIIILLKGRYSAIVRPDGKVFFNTSGTPAMATPGSGDVLAGIIGSLMVQGFKPEKASFIGCFIHGYAGQLSQLEHGEYGVTANDIANNVGKAIEAIRQQ